MILSSLDNEELLRVVQPQTELERLLVERLTAALDEVVDAQAEIREFMGSSCEGCDAKDDELSALEDEIEIKKERIEYLEKKLDEHDIEYDAV